MPFKQDLSLAKPEESAIENISYHNERRVDVSVGVAYAADVQETRKVLSAAADSLHSYMIEGEGRNYQVFLSELGASSVNWQVRFWTSAENYWTVWQELTEAIKVELEKANIGIPFPQMDIHFNSQTEQIFKKAIGE